MSTRHNENEAISKNPEENVKDHYVAKSTAPGADASLNCAVIGLFVCGIILGPIAIINANKAKKLIAKNPDKYIGEGKATAGLVIGIIDLAVWGIVLLIRLVAALG
jgi:hypothetical protein